MAGRRAWEGPGRSWRREVRLDTRRRAALSVARRMGSRWVESFRSVARSCRELLHWASPLSTQGLDVKAKGGTGCCC